MVPLVLLASARGAVWLGSIAGWAQAVPLLVMAAAAALILRRSAPFLQSRPTLRFWRELRRWAGGRTYSVWLVAIVVVLQQSSLLEHWLAGSPPRFNLPGGIVFLLLLGWIHARSPDQPVQFESRFLLAAALYFLLAAEWSDSLLVRRLSLGLLLMSAASWRRTWPWPLYGAVAAAWVALLPNFHIGLLQAGCSDTTARLTQISVTVAAFAAMLLSCKSLPHRRPRSFPDLIWMPNKRFALTLLFLLRPVSKVQRPLQRAAQLAAQYPPGGAATNLVAISQGRSANI